MDNLASGIICGVIVLVGIALMFSKRTSFDSFLDGTREGIVICKKLLPTLILLMVSVSMLSASGVVDCISRLIASFCDRIGISSELVPLILMRPISGAASNALISDLFEKCGPDSFAGYAASVMLGSSDTVIYICAVYFSAAGIKKTRHALPAAFAAMLFCVFFSSFIGRLFFR